MTDRNVNEDLVCSCGAETENNDIAHHPDCPRAAVGDIKIDVEHGPWLSDGIALLEYVAGVRELLPDYLRNEIAEMDRRISTLKRRLEGSIKARNPKQSTTLSQILMGVESGTHRFVEQHRPAIRACRDIPKPEGIPKLVEFALLAEKDADLHHAGRNQVRAALTACGLPVTQGESNA